MQGSEEEARKAADDGDFQKLKNMIEHGADIMTFKDGANQDNTLLHFATKTNNMQFVKFLKGIDADFSVTNANGETALHLCCG